MGGFSCYIKYEGTSTVGMLSTLSELTGKVFWDQERNLDSVALCSKASFPVVPALTHDNYFYFLPKAIISDNW